MGRFSRGIKRRASQVQDMPLTSKAYYKAKHIDAETEKQLNANKGRIEQVAIAYTNIFATYILKSVFHVSDASIDLVSRKLKSLQDVLTDDYATIEEFVTEIIRAKDNNGCKWPDYIPSFDQYDFDVAKEADKFVQAGDTMKQAIFKSKKVRYYNYLMRNAEIVMLVALHDVLGYSRKRLERYSNKFRELRSIDLQELRPLLYKLKERYHWDLTEYIKLLDLDNLEAKYCG